VSLKFRFSIPRVICHSVLFLFKISKHSQEKRTTPKHFKDISDINCCSLSLSLFFYLCHFLKPAHLEMSQLNVMNDARMSRHAQFVIAYRGASYCVIASLRQGLFLRVLRV